MTGIPDPQLVRDAANRLTAICEHFDTYGEWPNNRSDSSDIADLHAVLARLGQLEAEREGRLAQAYTSGWYDAIEAYRGPGWAEREAGWRKYREAVRGESADRSDTVDREPLPSIADGISDVEAEASGTFDLTIAEVRSLKADRDALAARLAKYEAAPPSIQINPGRELTADEVQALTDRFTMPAGRIAFLADARAEDAKNIAALEQQDNAAKPCACGCPHPGIEDMCCCPEPCPCSPCGYCDDPADGSTR